MKRYEMDKIMTIIFKNKDIEQAYYTGCKDKEQEIVELIENKLDEMMNMIHGDSDWDMGFDCAIETITKELNKLKDSKKGDRNE